MYPIPGFHFQDFLLKINSIFESGLVEFERNFYEIVWNIRVVDLPRTNLNGILLSQEINARI